ncbi:MAG TPA: Mbeg1-like protein [Verrucomicrobiae bacterium]|jgi:hypothetical protein
MVELAELCEAVYGDDTSVTTDEKGGRAVCWSRVQRWSDGSFFAALYTKKSAATVLAYRGTDDLAGDLVDDTDIAVGQIPPSARDAIQVAGVVSAKNVILTGHSLGGALAIIAAARFGLPAVTFNAPGVMNSCIMANAFSSGSKNGLAGLISLVGRCFTGSRMLNIRIDGDAVSSVLTSLLSRSLQPGGAKSNPASQCGIDLLCRHSMTTCIAAVESRSDGYEEVSF